jgi:hypothetical protein
MAAISTGDLAFDALGIPGFDLVKNRIRSLEQFLIFFKKWRKINGHSKISPLIFSDRQGFKSAGMETRRRSTRNAAHGNP